MCNKCLSLLGIGRQAHCHYRNTRTSEYGSGGQVSIYLLRNNVGTTVCHVHVRMHAQTVYSVLLSTRLSLGLNFIGAFNQPPSFGLAFLRCGGASPPAATRSRKTHVTHRRIKIERVYRPYLTATEAADTRANNTSNSQAQQMTLCLIQDTCLSPWQ
jgi:hypothetical protein